jgi:hypothetical protein
MTFDPIAGTSDWPLFQDFRYGLGKLGYTYPVQDGEYRVEMYFAEPWYGRGGGVDCTGWRLFDIAINNDTVARNVDLWKKAGYSRAVKKTFRVHVTGGKLTIRFPRVAAGQAVISAIAIATLDKKAKGAAVLPGPRWDSSKVFSAGTLEPAYDQRPMTAYKTADARVMGDAITWDISTGVADKYSLTLKYRWLGKEPIRGKLSVSLDNGTLIREGTVTFTTTREGKWNYWATSTGTMINAGRYKVRLTGPGIKELKVDELQVQ